MRCDAIACNCGCPLQGDAMVPSARRGAHSRGPAAGVGVCAMMAMTRVTMMDDEDDGGADNGDVDGDGGD
eukprot:7183750-Alexandrium_andersonii.AAC.1